MKIEIETLHEDTECDCCGISYAEGGRVFIDGELILERLPSASCTGSTHFSEDDLLVMALKKLGHDVFVDHARYHVATQDPEYHGAPSPA